MLDFYIYFALGLIASYMIFIIGVGAYLLYLQAVSYIKDEEFEFPKWLMDGDSYSSQCWIGYTLLVVVFLSFLWPLALIGFTGWGILRLLRSVYRLKVKVDKLEAK
jgi:hypothetical protein